jgi:hypothetical protein
MIETLAFVTIVVTQGSADIPAGTQFRSIEPIRCITGTDEGIKMIESMAPGMKADGFCDYTYAPAYSIRPKAGGDP